MATAVADMEAAETVNVLEEADISKGSLQQLQSLAAKRGWSLSEALRRAVYITGLILDAKDDPTTKIYIYRGGRRYSLNLHE